MVSTYLAQIGAAIRMSVADRTNCALQVLGMAINNGFFFLLWVLFFAGFRSVGGWRFPDICLLLGMAMIIVGAAGVFFGGHRDLAAAILRGEPDALLTQPKPPLPRLLAQESIASGWGDLTTGCLLLATLAQLDVSRVPLVMVGIGLGLTVYVSAAVMFASLAFWISGARSFARDLLDFIILLSSYPGSIYAGATKFIAYTLLPAGFVVLLPVEFVREPTLPVFGMAAGAAIGYAGVALAIFHAGLRRYRRGDTGGISA